MNNLDQEPKESINTANISDVAKSLHEEELHNYDNQKIVRVLIYTSEKKKYIDAATITALMDRNKENVYKYQDGFNYIVSSNVVINKGVPEGATLTETQYPDFSSVFPYDKELQLYEINDDQLNTLMTHYKNNHPNLNAEVTYRPAPYSNIKQNDFEDKNKTI